MLERPGLSENRASQYALVAACHQLFVAYIVRRILVHPDFLDNDAPLARKFFLVKCAVEEHFCEQVNCCVEVRI